MVVESRCSPGDEFIYASGSIAGLEGRSMEKPLVNLSY